MHAWLHPWLPHLGAQVWGEGGRGEGARLWPGAAKGAWEARQDICPPDTNNIFLQPDLTVPLCAIFADCFPYLRAFFCVQLEELYPGIRHKLAVALQVLGGGGGGGRRGRGGSGGVESMGVSVGRQGSSGSNTIRQSHCVVGVSWRSVIPMSYAPQPPPPPRPPLRHGTPLMAVHWHCCGPGTVSSHPRTGRRCCSRASCPSWHLRCR